MKIKLLNDGGFEGLEDISFPVELEATLSKGGMFVVKFDDVMEIPGAFFSPDDTDFGTKYSFFPNEVEVIS